MPRLTVKAVIGRSTAIAAGLSEYGTVEIEVDAGALTDRQREVLAGLGEGTLSRGDVVCGNMIRVPEIPADITTTLPQFLDHMAGMLEEAKAKAHADKLALAAKSREVAEKAVATPPEEWIVGDIVMMPGMFYQFECPSDLKDSIKSKHSEAWGILTNRRDAASAAIAATEAARREHEVAGENAKRAQVDEWIAAKGTASQRERYARGLLDIAEIVDAMRDEAFRPLSGMPRYTKITKDDLEDSYGFDGGALSCRVDDAETATEEEFQVLCGVEVALPGAKVTLQVHRCVFYDTTPDDDDEHAVERHSLKVEVEVGAYTFSRLYAV